MGIKEIHEGCIVRDNNDPQKRGRLIVECPTVVTGESLGEWMEPSFHFVDSQNSCGAFFIPSVGSIVTVEIESGSEAQANGLMPKWRCDIYPTDTVPEEFQEHYPERRGWKTRSGHVMYFDDTEDDKQFYYMHPSGTEIYVNNDGKVIIATDGDSSIRLGSAAAVQRAVLGDIFTDDLNNLVTAIRTYASDPAVQEVPGVMTACINLALACTTFIALHANHLSQKVVLE